MKSTYFFCVGTFVYRHLFTDLPNVPDPNITLNMTKREILLQIEICSLFITIVKVIYHFTVLHTLCQLWSSNNLFFNKTYGKCIVFMSKSLTFNLELLLFLLTPKTAIYTRQDGRGGLELYAVAWLEFVWLSFLYMHGFSPATPVFSFLTNHKQACYYLWITLKK